MHYVQHWTRMSSGRVLTAMTAFALRRRSCKASERETGNTSGTPGEAELVHGAVAENVRLQMRSALAQSPVLRDLAGKGEFGVCGAVYSLESGSVNFFPTNN